jgi:hypothetical protein
MRRNGDDAPPHDDDDGVRVVAKVKATVLRATLPEIAST